MYKLIACLVLLLAAVVSFGQNPVTADSPYQVRYAANLDKKDSIVNISNTGANGAPLFGPGGSPVGNICANVYVLAPDAQLIECCSCLVPPNGLESLSVKNDLISNVLQGSTAPTSVEVALISTLAGTGGTGTSCANSAANVTSATLASGMVAWMATNHATVTVTPGQYWWQPSTTTTTFTFDETAFTPSTLSAGEFASLGNRCQNIVGNGSGFGICRSCKQGGQ